ncbi:MAG: ABC transporter ATP-binding protein [Candidatus Aminicenantes bacterium]|nr:ABC transporter ATP-binding protein [Candidatus Aminicenantes bacterium]
MIQLNDIRKVYQMGKLPFEALKGIDLTIESGEFVAVMGPSGSGKSTLMNIIGCLDTASSGEYHLDERNVAGLSFDQLSQVRNRKIGFVFQNFNLLPYATSFENVELPLLFNGKSAKQRKERVRELLDKVGLWEWHRHRPTELSGGQQQRIAIARALVNEPPILLADEPTGNLDSNSGREIMEIFQGLWEAGKTVIMVTHDNTVAGYAKRIVRLLDGRVENGRKSA